MEGITQQAMQFALQYMTETHNTSLILLFYIDFTVCISLRHQQSMLF